MMPLPRWFYRYRGVILVPPLLLALLSVFRETELEIIWPIGSTIILLGIGIRILAQQHIHHRIKARQELTTTGLYSITRNPLYIANTLICLGAIMVSEEIWLIPFIFLYCCFLYSRVVRYEETYLLKEYGEPYREYLSNVPRWFPKTLVFWNGGLFTPDFFHALVAELPGLLILVVYILKEIIM